jgi:hypothetical protein
MNANSTDEIQPSCFDGGTMLYCPHHALLAASVFQANGEIYNHKNVRKQFTGTHNFSTGSDCEVIIPLVSLLPVYADRFGTPAS